MFESKLPKALKAQREAKIAEDKSKQSSIDPHLRERVEKERVIPYSDELFRDAAMEWVIATDQVRSLHHVVCGILAILMQFYSSQFTTFCFGFLVF